MKTKIVLLSWLALNASSVFSQPITLTEADMPHVGTTIIYYSISKSNVPSNELLQVGPGGENLTWDFSSVLTGGEVDTITYVDPQSTPYGASFPNATVTSQLFRNSSILEYQYLSVNSSEYVCMGEANTDYPSVSLPFVYNPAKKYLSLPAVYTSQFNGTSKLTYYYPEGFCDTTDKEIITKNYGSTIDGWGTINTPWGSYQCLRQQFNILWYDSLFCPDSTGAWILKQVFTPYWETFIWWANGYEFPIMYYGKMQTGPQIYSTWTQCLISSTAGTGENNPDAQLMVIPNPANHAITFDFAAPAEREIIIRDVYGKKIYSFRTGEKLFRIDTNVLNNGLYFYEIYNEKGEKTGMGKFIIE